MIAIWDPLKQCGFGNSSKTKCLAFLWRHILLDARVPFSVLCTSLLSMFILECLFNLGRLPPSSLCALSDKVGPSLDIFESFPPCFYYRFALPRQVIPLESWCFSFPTCPPPFLPLGLPCVYSGVYPGCGDVEKRWWITHWSIELLRFISDGREWRYCYRCNSIRISKPWSGQPIATET